MAVQEFGFRYLLYPITATLDESFLMVKMAGREKRAEVSRLRHLYVRTLPTNASECIVEYETEAGKRKHLRFGANLGEPGLTGLVAALVARRPEIDLRALTPKAAFKLMGAADTAILALPIVFIVALVVLGVIFLPALMHGLDNGSAVLDAAACRTGCPLSSRNVVLTQGYLNLEHYLEETTTTTDRGSTTKTVRYFIPFVPDEWQKNDPVDIVVQTPEIDEDELNALVAKTELPGVLRDVLWEGLAADKKAFFASDLKITLAPTVRLVEYGADTRTDLVIALVVSGGTLVLLLAISLIVLVKRR